MTTWLPQFLALCGALAPIIYGYFKTARKLDTIHVLVNSNLEQVKTDLSTAEARIVTLEGRHFDPPAGGPLLPVGRKCNSGLLPEMELFNCSIGAIATLIFAVPRQLI